MTNRKYEESNVCEPIEREIVTNESLAIINHCTQRDSKEVNYQLPSDEEIDELVNDDENSDSEVDEQCDGGEMTNVAKMTKFHIQKIRNNCETNKNV